MGSRVMQGRSGIDVVAGLLHDQRLARQIRHVKAGRPSGNAAASSNTMAAGRLGEVQKPVWLQEMGDDLDPSADVG